MQGRSTGGGVEPSDVEIGPHRVDSDGRRAGRTEDADCAGAEAAQDKKSRCCCPEGHLGVNAYRVRTKCQTTEYGQKQLVCPTTGLARLFLEDMRKKNM